MKKLFSNFNWGILVSTIVLLVLGLAMIGSVAPSLFLQQLISVFLGLLAFFLFSQVDYRLFPRLKGIFYFFSLLSLVLTFVFGVVTRGAVRWLQIGGFTFQPSELVKPFLILSFAGFLVSQPIFNLRFLIFNLIFLAFPAFLIFRQPDLGSSLVVIFFWVGMVFASEFSWRLVGLIAVFSLLILPIGWGVLQPYQRTRILSFLNPFLDPLDTGYNMIQSMITVGSGQIFGRGLGKGTQSHLRFLPEHHTDFIFASLAEELGFFGTFLLLLAYGFLFWQILKVAGGAKDKFASLICLGVFILVFSQMFVNIAMNLGMLPIAGITLPLISYGGSSLLATMVSLGIVENIARFKYTSQV